MTKKIRDERKEASQKELQLGEKEAKEKETREKTETRGDLQLTRQRKQGLFVFVYLTSFSPLLPFLSAFLFSLFLSLFSRYKSFYF